MRLQEDRGGAAAWWARPPEAWGPSSGNCNLCWRKATANCPFHGRLQEARGGAAAWWARPPEAWGPGQRLLACGAQVIAELRAAVREELGYSCSAGEGSMSSPGVEGTM